MPETSLWLWAGFNLFILAMLALDLGVFHRKAHEVSLKEATVWSVVWISLALVFNAGLWFFRGAEPAVQFFTGYLIEKSLSLDNIFVIVVIFTFFGVHARYQHRVLFWGVAGALVMRGLFIGVGSLVLQRWHWVIYFFGALLLFTGIRMAFRSDAPSDLNRNPVVRLALRLVPMTREYHGERFFVHQGGKRLATPLLLVLVLVEVSDVLFAVDSIPAVLAITRDPFIVYTSNAFAVLGLRSLYLLLAAAVPRIHYLKYGLAAILLFVGVKMLLMDVYEIPTAASLVVIVVLVTTSVLVSLRRSPGVALGSAPQENAATSGAREPAAHSTSNLGAPAAHPPGVPDVPPPTSSTAAPPRVASSDR